jgi:rhomboid protease GluP
VSATKAIVFLTGLVFVAMVATGFRSLLLIPPDVLVTFGASSGVETIARAELWRLVTSMFVHGSIFHVTVTMYVFWTLGAEVESVYGSRRLLAIYLASGICGALGSVFAHPLTVNVGSSAAVFGTIGALLAIVWRRPQLFPAGYLALQAKVTGALIICCVVMGLVDPTMDNAAHAAGFIGGFLTGLALLPRAPYAVLRAAAVCASLIALGWLAMFTLPKSGAVYFARAGVLHNEGRDHEAIALLSRAIESNPKIAVAYNNRAWSKEAVGDFRSALVDANKSIELDPKAATSYDTRAVAYIMLGDIEKALADLNKAVQLKEDDGAFYYHRAVAKQLAQDQSFREDAQRAQALKYKREHWEPDLRL